MESGLNLSKLAKYFSDEDAARELLEEMRWGKDSAVCPHCGGAEPYKLTPKATSKKPGRKGLYKCKACRKQFTVTVKTVFEDSRIFLSKWLLAIHLLSSSKKGMSAHQLHRNLGISYKAAWFMAHRLRYAMASGPLSELMQGTVEIDETYVGGKRKGHKTGRPDQHSHKTPVVALIERGTGRVKAAPMQRVTSENLGAVLREHVQPGTKIMSDEFKAYQSAVKGFEHDTVKHYSGEYVRGTVYTNTVEGFFSLLKRGVNGVYHHVSRGHLNRYWDEFAFRYENRKMSDANRANLLVMGAEGKRLTYKQPDSVS